MRGDPAAAIDVDANIDAAEIGRIEPDLETALAASCRDGDLKREPAQWHHRIGCRRHAQGCRGSGRGGSALRLDRARRLQACIRWAGSVAGLAGVGLAGASAFGVWPLPPSGLAAGGGATML